jgi:HPt (histidine-containing phosphotransfer) domain-containing protein
MKVKELADNLGLEEDEYVELVELLIETGMSDLDKLESAINAGDTEKAAEAAHSLKGAAGNLGITEFSQVAKQVEDNSRNGILEGASEAAQTLREQLDSIADSVRQ